MDANLTQHAPPVASPDSAAGLTSDERDRYRRQLTLPSFGLEGQERLKTSRVLIVGAGGLGSPAALYLAAAGVGTIGLVDHDVVDITNLHRQLLHGTSDVGRDKLASARDRLRDINPLVQVVAHDSWLTSANAMDIIANYDLVIDGADNFATRYLVNDACVLLGRPNVHGSVFRFDGQASVFGMPDGPCYRCLYPEPPPPEMVPNCAEGGVLGVLPGLVGTIQATEAIKVLLGIGTSLAGRLLMIDAMRMQFRTVMLSRDPECPACGTRTITALIDYDQFCGTPGLHALADARAEEISVATLRGWIDRNERITVIDVREPTETAAGVIGGARLVPMAELQAAMDTLPRDHTLVMVCKSGVRSARATRQLKAAGFTKVCSLAGGMVRWEEHHTAG
ncbi:putative molybdopterin biosynthesis protein MoeB [Gemmatimonas aurantiaca T-27]|uniref:Molybdopterin-synthase adenylyltransferase n=1 Tax=Gemmatimonas aurantiaca (strain DSM 14586 / JCM 11422 / NBRC 100505 / T-27) TaxID=379066 RepID=C1ADW2_GEMAT|nr:molybdopterin-synthase adenylyltransferase MoeB [Gemmatimonas aurantiaca]BAH40689.1 putative molybdopterin biosynthesis protein MoeB [Gemmatimonas aurantiaca T-27]